jgi:UDPglucose--hexose-1-phosphate uridylyltransferase
VGCPDAVFDDGEPGPDGPGHPKWTVHIEIQSIRRAPDKLKFLAGTELGAGDFANDVTPEAAAAALRNVRL